MLKKFSEFNAKIITFSKNKKKITKLEKFLKKKNINFIIESGDALDINFLDNFSEQCLKRYKKIDIFINNVGGGGRWGNSDILKTNDEVWDEVYKKNNLSLQFLLKKFYLYDKIKIRENYFNCPSSSTNFTEGDRLG